MGGMCCCFGWDGFEDDDIDTLNNEQCSSRGCTNFISKITSFFGKKRVKPLATEEPEVEALINNDEDDEYDDDDDDSDDGNCCPTCLENYTAENPKIIAKCNHHFHLPCIFAWQERSNLCPACSQIMEF